MVGLAGAAVAKSETPGVDIGAGPADAAAGSPRRIAKGRWPIFKAFALHDLA